MNRARLAVLLAAAALSAACGGSCPEEFLHACAKKGCAEKVKAALAKDASLANKHGDKGRFPLHVAADGDIAEALIAAGADVSTISGEQMSPLSYATQRDRGDVVKVLLAAGAKVHDPVYEARRAVRSGQPSVLTAYLDSGVSPDEGMLLDAVINDKVAVARVLLERGVSAKAAMGADMKLLSFGGSGPAAPPEDVSGKSALELAKSGAMRELLKKHGA